jgi:hypothetical protein
MGFWMWMIGFWIVMLGAVVVEVLLKWRQEDTTAANARATQDNAPGTADTPLAIERSEDLEKKMPQVV